MLWHLILAFIVCSGLSLRKQGKYTNSTMQQELNQKHEHCLLRPVHLKTLVKTVNLFQNKQLILGTQTKKLNEVYLFLECI